MLDSIVASFEQGYSAETIQQQYPALSLEEVYGAIAWYPANAGEVSQYLEKATSYLGSMACEGRSAAQSGGSTPTCYPGA